MFGFPTLTEGDAREYLFYGFQVGKVAQDQSTPRPKDRILELNVGDKEGEDNQVGRETRQNPEKGRHSDVPPPPLPPPVTPDVWDATVDDWTCPAAAAVALPTPPSASTSRVRRSKTVTSMEICRL
nr:hypothetical protein Iba_chr06bCG14580 [Ipomoea batatas]